MNRSTSFAQGLNRGFDTGMGLYRAQQEDDMRQRALKQQLENDEADRQIRLRVLKMQEEKNLQDLDARQQAAIMDGLRRADDQAWGVDPRNPAVQARQAQTREAAARAALLEKEANTKPLTDAEKYTVEARAWADEIARATVELQAAQQSGDQGQILKAQGILQGVQAGAQKWAEKPKDEPEVDIEIPSSDGFSKLKMKVPNSEFGTWENPEHKNHKIWQIFNPAAESGPGVTYPVPPPAAIQMLRANPQMRTDFEAKYGPGSAAAALK